MVTLEGKIKHLERTAKAFLSYKPNVESATFIEIGAHRGRSIVTLSNLLKKVVPNLHVIGYDIFDDETPEFHVLEDNGKGAGNYDKCNRALSKISSRNPNFTFELIRGYTTKTLKEQKAQWAYIDGGHSYETVAWDHQQLKESSVIVFDDADLEGVNRYLWEIRDLYKLYELKHGQGGARQVAIVNDEQHFNFETAEFSNFEGVDPTLWKPTR